MTNEEVLRALQGVFLTEDCTDPNQVRYRITTNTNNAIASGICAGYDLFMEILEKKIKQDGEHAVTDDCIYGKFIIKDMSYFLVLFYQTMSEAQ